MACPSIKSGGANTSTRLRVLVVDDSEYYIEAMCRLLATYRWVGATHQALSGSEALARIAADPPDLALVDIAMRDMNGLNLTQAIKAMPHPPKVVIVTLYDTPAYRQAAADAGADGFIGKSRLGEDLHSAIVGLFPCPGSVE